MNQKLFILYHNTSLNTRNHAQSPNIPHGCLLYCVILHLRAKKISTLAQRDRICHKSFAIPASSIELGRQKIEEGQYTQALAIFTECLEKQPDNVWAWHGKGDSSIAWSLQRG